MNLPKTAKIHEVGPRDGLQNEKAHVSTEAKIALVNNLAAVGLKSIEFGSFVSPKWVPQMADSDKVGTDIKRIPGVSYQALIMNEKGYDRAKAANSDSVNVVVATSETFNMKNMNSGVEQALENYRPIIARALQDNLPVSAYVSTAFGCPFEGEIAPQRVLQVSQQFLEMGAGEVIISDTIGCAQPRQVREIIELLLKNDIPLEKIGMHFHDTRGLALANVLASLESGVNRFDGSVGGMGGCPFAPGAQGNATTEDMVFMLEEMGVSTGIDVPALIEIAKEMESIVGHPLAGHLKNARLKPSYLVK